MGVVCYAPRYPYAVGSPSGPRSTKNQILVRLLYFNWENLYTNLKTNEKPSRKIRAHGAAAPSWKADAARDVDSEARRFSLPRTAFRLLSEHQSVSMVTGI